MSDPSPRERAVPKQPKERAVPSERSKAVPAPTKQTRPAP